MAAATIEDLPQAERDRIADEVRRQVERMDEATRRAKYQTSQSLGDFIANLAYSLARAAGYIIALPIAWAVRLADDIVGGFSSGWDDAWKSSRRKD